MHKIHQFAAIGECMIELAPQADDSNLYKLSYAGDTFNTAALLGRLIQPKLAHVNYLTAVGQDKNSQKMLKFIQEQGVDTRYISFNPKKQAGLYVIHNEPDGEREFSYYRQQSAARDMLLGDAGLALLGHMAEMDSLYFSGISLAIWQQAPAWDRFETALRDARACGKMIIFDSNIRLKLWDSPEQARQCFERFLPYCDVVLSTFDDEKLLYADKTPEQTLRRLAPLNIPRLVLKQGSDGCLAVENGHISHLPCSPVSHVVDTTGAGDAFNAGVIAALLNHQQSLPLACQQGHNLAAQIIQHRGALPPRVTLEC